MKKAFGQALEVLRRLDAQIGEASLPWAKQAIVLQMLTSDQDASSMYLDLLRSRWNDLDVGTRTRIATAGLVPTAVYIRAMRPGCNAAAGPGSDPFRCRA